MVNGSSTTSYNWDFENRMTSVVLPGSGGTVTFKYDPFGRRIYKSSSNGTSVYAYDGDNQVEETNASGAAVARYSEGLNIDEPLAMLRSATTSYYQADGLGSVTSLTSAAGAVAQTYSFDSFGNIVATTGSLANSFRYTGREFDAETGLYFYRTRYYDPAAGRFLSEDRVGFEAGTNFYPYVRNSSPNLWDPRGTQPCSSCSFAVKYAGYGAAGGAGLVAVGSLGVDVATGGVNIIATPAEIGLGAAAGGLLGYGVGTLADILTGNYCSSNPFRGKPGDVSTTRRPDGTPKQVRRYGPDGYPDTDVDHDHADHHPDVGSPHGHDWGRPADGSPPTHNDRGPGRTPIPTDPRPN
jgi:RHS repeat-associated protein